MQGPQEKQGLQISWAAVGTFLRARFFRLTKTPLNRCRNCWHSMDLVVGNWLQKYQLQLPTTLCSNCPITITIVIQKRNQLQLITITNYHYNVTGPCIRTCFFVCTKNLQSIDLYVFVFLQHLAYWARSLIFCTHQNFHAVSKRNSLAQSSSEWENWFSLIDLVHVFVSTMSLVRGIYNDLVCMLQLYHDVEVWSVFASTHPVLSG